MWYYVDHIVECVQTFDLPSAPLEMSYVRVAGEMSATGQLDQLIRQTLLDQGHQWGSWYSLAGPWAHTMYTPDHQPSPNMSGQMRRTIWVYEAVPPAHTIELLHGSQVREAQYKLRTRDEQIVLEMRPIRNVREPDSGVGAWHAGTLYLCPVRSLFV